MRIFIVEAETPPSFTENPGDFSRFFDRLQSLEAEYIISVSTIMM